MRYPVRRALALLLAVVLLVGAPIALVCLRPDWGYRVLGRLRDLGASAPLTPFSPTTVEYTPAAYADTLLLVSAAHPLPAEFVPTLTETADGAVMHPALAAAYAALSADLLAATGETLRIRDDYRSRDEQIALYADDPTLAALPGTGEHEAALALDLCVAGYGGMAFLKRPAGRYVGDHAHRYGLIIRYPDGRADETGIPYEPWHIRYVGHPHASIIAAGRMTLEGYLDALTPGEFYRYDDWCITRQAVGTSYHVPDDAHSITVAYDNTGYVVITCQIE